MKKNLLKTLLITAALAMGTSAWGETGDVTTNVDIDFSNEIVDNAVAGTKGTMSIGQSTSCPTEINATNGTLVVGNGTHTVEIDDAELAGLRDVVKVSFDLAFGKLIGKSIGFSLVGSDGNSIGKFSFCPYNSTFSDNTFGVDKSDMYYGDNTVSWDKKVTFTITIDYLKKTITTKTDCKKDGSTNTSATHVVALTNLYPLKTFKLTSSYSATGRRCQFDNLKIETTEGDYSVPSYVDVVLKAMCGETELVSTTVDSEVLEGKEVTYGFSKYVIKDEKLYEATKNSSAYYVGTTMATSAPVIINYTEKAITGTPEYFVELGALSTSTTSTSYLRSSGGGTASAASMVLVPENTLPDGIYTFELGNYKSRKSIIKVGDVEVGTLKTADNSGAYVKTTLENVVVKDGAAVTAVKNTSDVTDEIDYLLAIRTGDLTQDVSVSEAGLATYCPPVAVDFSSARKVAAYKAVVSGTTVNLTKVTSAAAGEGVLLRSVGGGATSETLPVLVTATKAEDNAFVGTLSDINVLEDDGTNINYVLSKEGNEVGFYKAAVAGTKVGAGKAYLPVAKINAAKGMTFVYSDDATGISEIATDVNRTADGAIYSLSGVRVQNPSKGLYIMNGKKVIVK